MGISKEVTGVFVELNGQQKINIKTLNKEDYEDFLRLMNDLRLMYIGMIEGEQINTNKNNGIQESNTKGEAIDKSSKLYGGV